MDLFPARENYTDEWTTEIDAEIANHSTLPLLFSAETQHIPLPLDDTARHDSINWILKVIDFHRFNPVTAYRSVNYLDRFLSANSLPVDKQSDGGWAMQLLSVACLSIAAKLEETHVPLLSDLQILNPKYVFEPRTILRMELLLMAALQWRMHAVTPFDFLPYLAAAVLPVNGAAIFSRAADLIISSRRDSFEAVVDFLRFRPSVIAAAAALCASAEIAAPSATDNADWWSYFSEWINKEVVGECRRLMEEYLIDDCPSELETPPHSPVGVLDAASCATGGTERSADAELPPFKRRRLVDGEFGAGS